jgi:hypothetical protein
VIVWRPELLGVNVTLHVPAPRVHWPLVGVKVPVPDVLKVTVPVGVPLEPLTVAVQVVRLPAGRSPGLHMTVVVEVVGIDTVAYA